MYGFQKELEQEVMKNKRFKVYDLAKLSDLESYFNSEALGSIAHCETGLKNTHQGLLPSATTFNNRSMNKTQSFGIDINKNGPFSSGTVPG